MMSNFIATIITKRVFNKVVNANKVVSNFSKIRVNNNMVE